MICWRVVVVCIRSTDIYLWNTYNALDTEISPEDAMMEKNKALVTRVLTDQSAVPLQGPVLWSRWLGSSIGHFFKHQCPSLANCCGN